MDMMFEVETKTQKSETQNTRTFFWRDKTGRGFSATLKAENLLDMENEEDWDDELLHDFAETAEVGDRWENMESEITCVG